MGSYRPPSARADDETLHYLVMELVDGETLSYRLARGPLSVAEAFDIGRQIASALRCAHEAGIIHRDLKRNIMLTSSGAKLLDVGLAKIATTSGTRATPISELTVPGMILGTMHYMAPEQIEGRAPDARTDIFAFGTVLYEMITGRKAFDGRSSAALLSNRGARRERPASHRRAPSSAEGTVRNYLSEAIAKLGVSNRIEAARLARQKGWL